MGNTNSGENGSKPETQKLSQPDKEAVLRQNEEIPIYKDELVYKDIPKSVTKNLSPPHLGHTPPRLDTLATSANSERSKEHYRNLYKVAEKLKDDGKSLKQPIKPGFNRFKNNNPNCR